MFEEIEARVPRTIMWEVGEWCIAAVRYLSSQKQLIGMIHSTYGHERIETTEIPIRMAALNLYAIR